jgi:chitin synthase
MSLYTTVVLIASIRFWAVWDSGIYDLTDYFFSIDTYSTDDRYQFLNSDLSQVFQQMSGQDASKEVERILGNMDSTTRAQNVNCLKNVFYAGRTDFRQSARCQTQKYLLIVFSAIVMASMVLKCQFILELPFL